MNNEVLKRTVKKWADKIGHKEAAKRLISVDISMAVTQKLIAGNYESALSYDKAKAIIDVLAKDGITLAGGKAS